jgi:hypothetical protein
MELTSHESKAERSSTRKIVALERVHHSPGHSGRDEWQRGRPVGCTVALRFTNY